MLLNTKETKMHDPVKVAYFVYFLSMAISVGSIGTAYYFGEFREITVFTSSGNRLSKAETILVIFVSVLLMVFVPVTNSIGAIFLIRVAGDSYMSYRIKKRTDWELDRLKHLAKRN